MTFEVWARTKIVPRHVIAHDFIAKLLYSLQQSGSNRVRFLYNERTVKPKEAKSTKGSEKLTRY